ncbi:MAG: hypothetical protein E6R13_04240 [Spirochaetes bacterium]|nr:MAG: hypothetical protein E6R13_04240 [Spirochaetota bacterium]
MLTQDQIKLLETQKNIELLKKRDERYAYYGILQEYQLHSKDELQKLDYKKLNPYQHFLFKRVLHGLNVYTAEEVKSLHWDKKRRIKKVWLRGQEVINEWKQMICNKKVNDLLYRFFGENVRPIIDIPAEETLPDYKNTLTLKDLGLSYEDLILKFMSEGLLPKNFLTLKPNGN